MSELIKVSKEFKGLMGGLWLGIETTIPEGADKIKAFADNNELLERAWMAMNPQIAWSERTKDLGVYENYIKATTAIDEPIPIDEKVEGMKQLLSMCTTPMLLERQRMQVERLGNDEVTKLFKEKLRGFEG